MLIQETRIVYNFITLKLPEINATYQKKKMLGQLPVLIFIVILSHIPRIIFYVVKLLKKNPVENDH